MRTFCYASLLLDSYSKMLLGYSIGETLSSAYPIAALGMALQTLESHDVDLSRYITATAAPNTQAPNTYAYSKSTASA